MTLIYPAYLWLIIPLIILFYKSHTLQNRVHTAIAILIVLSLARPAIPMQLQKSKIEAKDLILALDLSYSMQANDLTPSRYGYAKRVISELLRENPGDNVMLLAFTTNPLLLSPPTTDHKLIEVALESLRPEFILTKGTSLKRLFEKLPALHSEGKDLILITDGGEEQRLEPLIKSIQKANVHLTILAVGTAHGTTIPDKEGSALKDKEGNLVISRINPLLQRLSRAVEGNYLNASGTPEQTAHKLSQLLKGQNKSIEKTGRHYRELYWIPLLLATLLFLMLHTKARRYLLLLPLLAAIPAQAGFFDLYHLKSAYGYYKSGDFNKSLQELEKVEKSSLQSTLLRANSYYKTGAYEDAIQTYRSIRSKHPKIKQQLYYNIANAYALQGSYDKAKIYYTKALQLGEDEDSRENLKRIFFLESKKAKPLGMARPKSQNDTKDKAAKSDDEMKKKPQEEQSQSGGNSSGGAKEKTMKQKERKEGRLLPSKKEEKHPLGSKVYELINKGYIRETKPW